MDQCLDLQRGLYADEDGYVFRSYGKEKEYLGSRGGRTRKVTDGYVTIVVPNRTPGSRLVFTSCFDFLYPCCRRDRYVMLEHRFVMQNLLGRPLDKKETIHHKNGLKWDNEPENLELWTGNHPHGVRMDEINKLLIENLTLKDEIDRLKAEIRS